MRANRVVTARGVRNAMVMVLLLWLSVSAVASSTAEEPAPCDLRDEIRALNVSFRELVDLLEADGVVSQILALDGGIANLDSSLREVLREREAVTEELTDLRGGYEMAVSGLDDSATNETTRAQLRGFLPVQAEKIALREERLAHLEARTNELRDTIRKRQLERAQFEEALEGNTPG